MHNLTRNAFFVAVLLATGGHAAAQPVNAGKPNPDIAVEFLKFAIAGNTEEAMKWTIPGTVSEKKVAEIKDAGASSTKVVAVLANDKRVEVVFAKQTLQNGDKQLEGHVVLTMAQSKAGPWRVKDVDFRDANRVKERLAAYLEGAYDAKP